MTDEPIVMRRKDTHSWPVYGICISASPERFPSIIVEFPIIPSSGFPPTPSGGPPAPGFSGGGSSRGGNDPMSVVPNPHWIRVSARPACEPNRPACVVCRRYVSTNPGSWKNHDMRVVSTNTSTEPVGNSSMIMSPFRSTPDGACTMVSQ